MKAHVLLPETPGGNGIGTDARFSHSSNYSSCYAQWAPASVKNMLSAKDEAAFKWESSCVGWVVKAITCFISWRVKALSRNRLSESFKKWQRLSGVPQGRFWPFDDHVLQFLAGRAGLTRGVERVNHLWPELRTQLDPKRSNEGFFCVHLMADF